MNLKPCSSNRERGVTLTELLVASILIGIVMLGAASFSSSLKGISNSFNKSTVMSLRITAVMSRIVDDAYLAVGDETNWGVAWNGNQSICFRQAAGDVSTYADDNWVCYYRDGSDILSLCTEPTNPAAVPVTTSGQCDGGTPRQEILELTQPNFFQIVQDASGRLDYIDISLTSRPNPGLAQQPVTNPEYTLITQTSPPGHSR